VLEQDSKIFIKKLEELVGHPLKDIGPLVNSLTHRSYVNEIGSPDLEDNERLEFLGDSVLDLIISDELMHKFPQEREGTLSKYRSAIVNERSLASAAKAMDLGSYLKLGRGEELTAGREKDSILANAFEAVVAAIYVSEGLRDAGVFVLHHLKQAITSVQGISETLDYKTSLQELTQKVLKTTPNYVLTYEGGPDHDKVFESQVLINDHIYGRGRAKSKKDSEQLSAMEALRVLEEEIGKMG